MDNQKFCIKSGYILREIAGECLAIPVAAENQSEIVVLNPVSALIWKELETEKSLDEIAEAVCKNFDVSKDEARADAAEFLEILKNGGVLK